MNFLKYIDMDQGETNGKFSWTISTMCYAPWTSLFPNRYSFNS